jgi:hypothetical protein
MDGVRWTEAARARVHPRVRTPGSARWPDAVRAGRLAARLQEVGVAAGRPGPRDLAREVRRLLKAGAREWPVGDERCSLLVGLWAASSGPGFALRVVAGAIDVPSGTDPDELGLWHALRRLGCSLADEDFAGFEAAATAARADAGRLGEAAVVLRCALSYAVPERGEWAAADGRELLARLAGWTAQPLLHGTRLHGWCVLASTRELELAEQLVGHLEAFAEARADTFAPTLLDAFGADALPVLARMFDRTVKASGRRAVADTIALLETPAAATWFAAHVADSQAGARAVAWLREHPGLAIPALSAAAKGRRPSAAAAALLQGLGAPSAARVDAEDAKGADVPKVFTRLGPPRRKLPSWVDVGALPPLRLVAGGRLPGARVASLLAWLAESGPEADADVAREVRATLAEDARGELVKAVLQAWLAASAPPKDGWVLPLAASLAPESAADTIARLIEGWAREGRARRAVLGTDALVQMGTDAAVFAIQRLAAKSISPALQERATQALLEIAEARGVTADVLEELVLPDLGLDIAGQVRLDYGARRFRAGFDERSKAAVRDDQGRPLARLPAAAKADDARMAEESQQRWREVRAAGEFVLTRQAVRFERAMCARRTWAPDAFDRLVRHPLVAQIAKRLVFRAGDTLFRIAEDWTLADVEDREWLRPAGAHVVIPHRLEVDDRTAEAWDALLGAYGIVPPFPQMQRPVFRPTEREQAASEILRVQGRPTSRSKMYGLRHRGWEGPPDEQGTILAKRLDEAGDLVAYLEVADAQLGRVRVRGGARVRLGDLDPVVFSELVRDLDWAAL